MFQLLLLLALAQLALIAQVPHYADKAVLKAPVGYRDWHFVGSNLGISYSENAGKDPNFKNVYIPRAAAEAFKRTGTFPEKTMLVMEVYQAKRDASPAKHGQFEGNFIGIEVAVKDKAAVAEGWAYYNFIGDNGEQKQTAKAFGKQACFSCHKEHAAKDNVFVQFYPRLRDKD